MVEEERGDSLQLFEEFLRIPEERVAVLIGRGGKDKKEIERKLECKIEVSSDGEVTIRGADPLNVMKAREIVLAIARGFSPENAMKLLDLRLMLEIINLQELLGRNPNRITRQKARIIGTHGSVKKQIEHMTNTLISVYGKTVAIIGPPSNVRVAREAIIMLAEGAKHTTVYSFIKRNAYAIDDYPFK